MENRLREKEVGLMVKFSHFRALTEDLYWHPYWHHPTVSNTLSYFLFHLKYDKQVSIDMIYNNSPYGRQVEGEGGMAYYQIQPFLSLN